MSNEHTRRNGPGLGLGNVTGQSIGHRARLWGRCGVLGLLMLGGGWTAAGQSGEGLVDLRFGPVDPAVAEARSGDLRVMARVIERAVRPAGLEATVGYGMGIPLWLAGSGTEGVRAMSVEGFGAVFSFSVDLPLTPGRGAGGVTNRPTAHSTWETARREVEGGGGDDPGPEPVAAHDPSLVARLQEQLVAVLRQATNIRHLAAGEFVAVVVEGPMAGTGFQGEPDHPGMPPGEASGGGAGFEGAVDGSGVAVSSGSGAGLGSAGSGGGSVAVYGSGMGGTVRRSFRWGFGGAGGGVGGGSGAMFGEPSGRAGAGLAGDGLSVLTLRVSKADLDALATGGMTAEAWAARVRTHAYSTRSPGLTGGRRLGF
jgi:hypothetical protein